MTGLLKDLRYAGRMLLKNPGLSSLAVVALAFGIGFTTIMFSIVNAALIRGLPFEGGDRIMVLERSNPSTGATNMSVPVHDYTDWREQQRSFDDLAAYYTGTVNVSGSERAERFDGGFITPNTFDVLGVRPILGRSFREDEDGAGFDAQPVILLSHHVWRDRYDSDPKIVGKTLRANGRQMTVVGVMPEGFRFPHLQDVWLPLPLNPVQLERGAGQQLDVFGRLRKDVSLDQAMAEFAGIAGRLASAYPETNEGIEVVIEPYSREVVGDEGVALLYTMLGAVFLVLLIACANVANLLLARAAVRTREVAIRTAMGASRFEVITHLLAEALALAAVGAVLGTGIAWVGVELFDAAVASSDPPYWLTFDLDLNVLLFVVALTGVAALASGLLPAVRASRTDPGTILKDDSRGSSGARVGRLSRALVVSEVAFSMGLLVAAGLMLQSVLHLRNLDYPFTTDVFTARLGLFETEYPEVEDRDRFWRDLHERLSSLPGVQAATVARDLPGTGAWWRTFQVQGQEYAEERNYPTTRQTLTAPGFFDTFEMEILEGRDFTWQDTEGTTPVAIANRSFARKYFPGQEVIGKRVRFGGAGTEEPWLTIVGLVPDSYMAGVGNSGDQPQDGLYIPLGQHDARFLSMAVRGQGTWSSFTPVVRNAVTGLDADLPIYWVDSLQGKIDEQTWVFRVFGTLFMIFGAVALFMASVGLYGVMAFSVSNRTSELGIRMALGAAGRDVLALVVRQGAVQIALGLAIGLVLAYFLSNALQLLFFQVSPRDPVTFLAVAAVLAASGMVATLVPARRATRVDPVVSLRYEG